MASTIEIIYTENGKSPVTITKSLNASLTTNYNEMCLANYPTKDDGTPNNQTQATKASLRQSAQNIKEMSRLHRRNKRINDAVAAADAEEEGEV